MLKKFFHIFGLQSLLLSTLLTVSSCYSIPKGDGPTEIRIVDLNGNPRPIKKFTPEGNVQAMAQQNSGNNTNNSQGQNAVAAPVSQELAPVATAPVPQNNFANIANSVVNPNQVPSQPSSQIGNPAAPQVANKEESVVSYDMSNDAQQPASNSGSQKTISVVDAKNQISGKSNPVAPVANTSKNTSGKKFKFVSAPDGNASGNTGNSQPSSVKSSARASSKAQSKSGTFIQIASFASKETADQTLNKNSKISSGKIEEVNIADRANYRVLLGPVSAKNTEKVLKQVKNAGYKDAFIVK